MFTGLSGVIVRTGLSYVAWTQIIPAVFAWMFAILMLTALGLISLDARGENPAASLQAFAERFPGLSAMLGAWLESNVTPSITAATDPETGAVDLGQIDFWGAAGYLWFWLSLVGTVVGYALGAVFGPRPRRSLGGKLLVAVGACVGFGVILFAVLMSLPPNFQQSPGEKVILALSAALIVLVVTSWSVAFAHGMGKVADVLAPVEAQKQSEPASAE